MTLTSLCHANTFFRKEAAAGNKLIREEKLELISQLEEQPTRKVEKILLSHSDQPEIHHRETVKKKTEALTEIKLLINEETMKKLNRLKQIHSHEMPNATFAQIVAKLAAIGLEKLDPVLKAKRALNRKSLKSSASLTATATPAPERTNLLPKRSRYIPAAVKHSVWMRDKGRCTFTDPQTGECCESRKLIACDHIVPYAHGGGHTKENLRLRCQAHNHRHAIETLGVAQASRYRQKSTLKRI